MSMEDVRIPATGKTVLLFSGGLDSLTIAKVLEPDVLLHAPMNSPFTLNEREAVDGLLLGGHISRDAYVDASGVFDLSRFDNRHDRIVPNRNAYLAMLGSHYGENIVLGVVAGEARSTDKDEEFCCRMEDLLNHIWKQPAKWCEPHTFNVEIPFVNVTKTELVRRYLVKGGDPQGLLISYSCYNGGLGHCGHCTACFRKWVALELNRIWIPRSYFRQDPWTYPTIAEKMPLILKHEFRGPEDVETLDALKRVARRESYKHPGLQ